jgi:YD repeat-containing protein
MRCSRSVLLSLSLVSLILLACGSLFAAPVISNLNPNTGATGTPVIITGTGFGSTQGSSTVKFGTVTATVTNWSNTGTSITANVPSGVTNGVIGVVVTVSNQGSTPVNFTVTNPAITNLSINSAPVDQEITINGSNFGGSQGTNSSVKFNGTLAVPSYWSNSLIAVPVPTGATTGNIIVNVNGNSTLPVPFMVTPAPQLPGVHFIQGNYNTNVPHTLAPTYSASTPFPIEQTAGDLNVVIIAWRDTTATINSVTDSAGNSYTLAVSGTQSTLKSQKIYYAKNIAGASSNSVTVVFSTNPTLPDIRIGEYRGLDQNSPLDVVTTGSGTATTANSQSVTTTHANDLLVGADVIADGQNTGSGTGYTSRVFTYTGPVNNSSEIFEDKIVTAVGSYNATAPLNGSHSYLMQMVAFKQAANQAPVVSAGPNQTITLPTNAVTLGGTATDDGLPNNTLTLSWTKVSGPGTVTFGSPNMASTSATFSTFGTYVLKLTANDSQLSSSSNVTVTVNSQPISLTLNPLAAGPNFPGPTQTQTMTALLKNGTGPTAVPISNVSVSFTVTGANTTSGNATTNSSGVATFTYTGANSGTDTVTASYTGQNSNSANVSWLVPMQPVSMSTVRGRFYLAPELPNCICNGWPNIHETWSPTDQLAFEEDFPAIVFDPPGGVVQNNPGYNTGTRPFTDVTTDQNANFTGAIVAQGNGYQAGVGALFSFKAVFTGTMTVASAGSQTIYFVADDGWTFGMGNNGIPGNNPTLVSGTLISPPASMPFTNYPVVAAYNQGSGPFYNAIVINFPAAGTYPYELDYYECCGGELSMTLTTNVNTPQGSFNGTVTPSGYLALTPTNPASLPTGQTQTFTIAATNASGAAAPNAAISFIVSGANQRQLTGTTDVGGHATFQYTGTNAGTDTVQVSANISGMGAYSNQVTMTWTVSNGSTNFTPQGWIGSPAIGTIVQTQVPITVASGINLTSGTLTYWPTSNPATVTTLTSNTTGSGTIGTFDATLLASGGYTIQLNATASGGTTQVSQITVSVVGENKLGRMKSTVTEFKVPLAGIPITITRTYDSLDKNKVEDFGYGWKLGTFVDLTVDAQNNVTFNFNGQKTTFFFTPQSAFFGLPWLNPAYTPQAGAHGSLISNGCGGLLRLQTGVVCFPSTGQTYQPTLYQYTDPAGRVYTITSTGQLQSIQDLNGNTLTITPTGITSSVNGLVIPFVRDGSGRITQITDLNNNNYTYSYDQTTSELASVQYPGLSSLETYAYDVPAQDCPTMPTICVHLLKSEVDPRGNSSSAAYYPDGRLQNVTGPSVSDANGNPTQYTTLYSYNLSTNTTTITNPDGGTITRTDDGMGKPLTLIEQVNGSTSRTTTYQYDANENLIKMIKPCGNASCSDTTGNDTWNYTYDANGFQTSIQDPLSHTSQKTYNQFGGELAETDAQTRTRKQQLTTHISIPCKPRIC